MTAKNYTAENGSFRKRQGFTMASNSAIRDKNTSLKVKGLYTLIMSYITMPDLILTKDFLRKHCKEGKKAFETAWFELKENGYLKVYMQPSNDHGRWCVQYDLLDVADTADGVHTYYSNLAGEITDTNISKKERRTSEIFHVPAEQRLDRCPQNEGNRQRIPPYGIYAKSMYDKGNDAKRGNNIILSNNTSDNTLDNHSLYQATEEGTSDSELIEQVIDDLIAQRGIPYLYAADKKKMEAAIHYLTDWDFWQQHPHTTVGGSVDEQKMNAFSFCVGCLVDMACARETQSYRDSHITCYQVIDAINRTANDCVEGGLSEFMDEAIDDFTKACTKTEICDLRKYTMSLIWNCFSTYKVKQDMAFLASRL